MRSVTNLLFILLLALAAAAQKPDDIFATATGHVFKFGDLSAETQKLVTEAPANYIKSRADLYEEFISLRLLEAEAASRGLTTSQVIVGERAKVKDPTEVQIKAVYDANRAQIGDQTLAQVRK